MANNESEAPVSSSQTVSENSAQDAVAAAGEAVGGAVAAASGQTGYTEPTAEQKADIEDDVFGGESDRVVEPAAAGGAGDDGPYEPQGIIASRP
ncbi:hypothetical protein ACGFZP_05490 [Kitasatospora sp. NPDC048239]|uniref:hypothetical protein n=1 Tax=Kitasatospora sp. NPDC048239 TaxID=3364046 RepID=UPI00371E454B